MTKACELADELERRATFGGELGTIQIEPELTARILTALRTPSPGATLNECIDGRGEPDDAAIQRALKAFNGGIVRVQDAASSRGYTVRYRPGAAMRAAIRALSNPEPLAGQGEGALDPTLGYGSGHWDAQHGVPRRGSSPEYEDGYNSGRADLERARTFPENPHAQ